MITQPLEWLHSCLDGYTATWKSLLRIDTGTLQGSDTGTLWDSDTGTLQDSDTGTLYTAGEMIKKSLLRY